MPSSVIAHMVYDEKKQVLKIIYVSGAVYNYQQVPAAIYEEMKKARSKGTFLNTRIKGNFSYTKVRAEK